VAGMHSRMLHRRRDGDACIPFYTVWRARALAGRVRSLNMIFNWGRKMHERSGFERKWAAWLDDESAQGLDLSA